MRKPDREIYELTLERLGHDVRAADCLFVDDLELNIEAARELGFSAVHFRDNEQGDPRDRSRARARFDELARTG